MAFSGVISKIFTADPRYIPKYPSAEYVLRNASNLYIVKLKIINRIFFYFYVQSYIDLYMNDPSGNGFWFWSLVLTKSNGKTTVTPIIPAIPPFTIFGNNLWKYKNIHFNTAIILYHTQGKLYNVIVIIMRKKNNCYVILNIF